jgi:hypothetical protein
MNLSELNFNVSHVIAKKGGKSVSWQERKKAKTTNIFHITDGEGYIIAIAGLHIGNHDDAYNLNPQLQAAIKSMKRLVLTNKGAFFNADKILDTKDPRKTYFNHQVIPNMDETKPNRRKSTKCGRMRLFNPEVYKYRFACEKTFVWIDKFNALLVRFERKGVFSVHFIAYTMINLHHWIHS